MKLSIISELNYKIDPNKIDQSYKIAVNAPKTHEIAWVGDQRNRISGSKNRVTLNLDLNDPKNNGFISHTHPITNGVGTILGALPSAQDIESLIQVSMKSGNDKFNRLTSTFLNDRSDIEGMIIWHGNHYVTLVPTEKVNLSQLSAYEGIVKRGDFEKAINILQRMGFYVKWGSK